MQPSPTMKYCLSEMEILQNLININTNKEPIAMMPRELTDCGLHPCHVLQFIYLYIYISAFFWRPPTLTMLQTAGHPYLGKAVRCVSRATSRHAMLSTVIWPMGECTCCFQRKIKIHCNLIPDESMGRYRLKIKSCDFISSRLINLDR